MKGKAGLSLKGEAEDLGAQVTLDTCQEQSGEVLRKRRQREEGTGPLVERRFREKKTWSVGRSEVVEVRGGCTLAARGQTERISLNRVGKRDAKAHLAGARIKEKIHVCRDWKLTPRRLECGNDRSGAASTPPIDG